MVAVADAGWAVRRWMIRGERRPNLDPQFDLDLDLNLDPGTSLDLQVDASPDPESESNPGPGADPRVNHLPGH
jgi:hypothetical protein